MKIKVGDRVKMKRYESPGGALSAENSILKNQPDYYGNIPFDYHENRFRVCNVVSEMMDFLDGEHTLTVKEILNGSGDHKFLAEEDESHWIWSTIWIESTEETEITRSIPRDDILDRLEGIFD